jgi:putative ATPase
MRRLLILAGEDIGLADPMGLVVANAAAQAFEFVGMPEGIYSIVEATLYLATAPKSNSAGAYFKALKRLEDQGQISVPNHLKDGNRDAAQLKHGEGYVYPHAEEGHFIPQQYLPKRLLGTYFYAPSNEGYEAEIVARLERWREAQRKALGINEYEFAPELSEEKIQKMKRNTK